MNESALDIPGKEVDPSSVSNGAINVITLSSHPLWHKREYDRLIAFLEGKPDSGWHKIFNYYEGDDHVDRGKEWMRDMIASGAFTNERILELAKTIAPSILFLDRIKEGRKNQPPLPAYIFEKPKKQT